MTFAALLLALAPVGPAPVNDIVVYARKVESVSLTIGKDAQGRTTCGISRSSGDTGIDSALCKRAARCFPKTALSADKRDQCLAKQRKAIIAEWSKAHAS